MNHYKTELVGKVIASVRLEDNKEHFVIAFVDGTEQAFGAEGDCCSVSWIEHLEAPDDLAGASILAVEDLGEVENAAAQEAFKGDCLSIYQTHFKTTKGTISLEYRNESNGYYGGWLVALDLPPTDKPGRETP